MPVTKSAKKKLRQDKKRTLENRKVRELLKDLIKQARKKPSEKSIKDAIKIADKAVKKNLIHKNKAARIKSGLSKLLKQPVKHIKPSAKEKPAKKTPSKKSPKK